jgi:hypothetical protein
MTEIIYSIQEIDTNKFIIKNKRKKIAKIYFYNKEWYIEYSHLIYFASTKQEALIKLIDMQESFYLAFSMPIKIKILELN